MVWGWAISTVFLMFIAMAMAELGSSAPTSGTGLYYWTYKFASPRFRNLLCWIVGYMNTITYISSVAGVDWAGAVLIMAAASISSDGAFIPTVYQTFGVYCAVIISHAFVASCAAKVVARLQYLFIAINIALVLVMVIGLPIATPKALKNDAKYAFGSFSNLTLWPNGYTFILSFLAPLWSVGELSFLNWVSGEEALNANVAVPWAIMSVTAIGCILGFAVQISVAFCMGADPIAILSNPVQQPMATILLNSFGKRGMLAIWAFIFFMSRWVHTHSLQLYGWCEPADILIPPNLRVRSFCPTLDAKLTSQYHRFSRDGALPFSSFLYKINSFTGTPVRCVWVSATCAALLGLIPFAGPAAAGALFSLGVIGQYITNSIPIATRYLGGQPFKKGPFHLGAFSMPVAIIAVLWMCLMAVVLLFPAVPAPVPQTMNYTVVVLFGVWFLAIGYYYLPYYGGMYWFEGPISTVQEEGAEKDSAMEEKTEGHNGAI
ncbi:APC amino acid permease [Mycena rebaudengoi]|nr:APC amino acid permease [Mycena rebaudengoi]